MLNSQNIYLSPYTPSTQNFEQYLLDNHSIKIKGYFDASKSGHKVFNPDEIEQLNPEKILIFSPNWDYDIYLNLRTKIDASKIELYKQKGIHYYKKQILPSKIKYIKKHFWILLINALFHIFHIKITKLWTNRIGEMSVRSEILLRKISLRKTKRRYIILGEPDPEHIANKPLYSLYKKAFSKNKHTIFIDNAFLIHKLRYVMSHSRFNPKYKFMMLNTNNEAPIFRKTSKVIELTASDHKKGQSILEKMNIRKPFICIFARDSAYLNHAFKDKDWKYHDCRDFDINTVNKTSLYLISKGYNIVRIGSVSNTPCTLKHEDFIDYTFSEYQSEFMDIYLLSQCEFVLGSTSGLMDVSHAFGTIRLGINYFPIDHTPFITTKDIFLPKKLKYNNKYLSLNDFFRMVQPTNLNTFFTETYEQLNITIENNNEDEILDLVKDYLQENPKTQVEYEQLQRYHKIHLQSKYFPTNTADISYTFLRKNPWFLED